MFFFPFATDAPLYHWPIVTVLLILVNVATYLVLGPGVGEDFVSRWVLHYGHVNPIEWVTNNFMHADLIHLIGNMAFLWPFGLIVEGKLGWWRFLLTYLSIGTIYGAVMQLSMFATHTEGCALGASAAIFGLIALALVWAPRNELSVGYLILFGFRGKAGVVQVSILAFGALYLAWQVMWFAIGGFHVSTEALHLTGFAVGFPLGILMLKLKWVDCEGWDLLSTWATGRPIAKDERTTRKEDDELAQRVALKEADEEIDEKTAALALLKSHLAEGRNRVAYAVYCKHNGPGKRAWSVPEPQLVQLIEALRHERMWAESIPLLRELIARSPQHAPAARLKLAHFLIEVERRPKQALAVLAKVPAELPDQLKLRQRQLRTLAQKAIDEGEMEVTIEDW